MFPFSSAAELNVVTIDLLKYMDGRHMLDILGLTQTNDILRSTLDFYGLGKCVPSGYKET